LQLASDSAASRTATGPRLVCKDLTSDSLFGRFISNSQLINISIQKTNIPSLSRTSMASDVERRACPFAGCSSNYKTLKGLKKHLISIVRAGLRRCADGIQEHEVSLGTFPLPGTRIVDINRGWSNEDTKFKASGGVNRLRNIYQWSGMYGASAPANDRAMSLANDRAISSDTGSSAKRFLPIPE